MIVNLYLFWGAWQDLRRRKISNNYLWIGGILGVVYRTINLVTGAVVLREWLWALIPGVIFITIAKVTKEKIGLGDGWVILIMGNFLNLMEVCYMLQAAIFVVIIFSCMLLCSKKVTREYQIPFLPFLWTAHTFLWGLYHV